MTGDWGRVSSEELESVAGERAEAFGAERFDVFALSEVDGLDERLGERGDSGSGFGLDVAADEGRDDARDGCAEIEAGT